MKTIVLMVIVFSSMFSFANITRADEIDDLRKIGLNDLEIDFIKNLKVKEYISLELTKKNSP